jgi:predicted nucleic acid-binding protein
MYTFLRWAMLGLADAIIAATAEHANSKLATLKKKHYPMLKDILIPYNKTS